MKKFWTSKKFWVIVLALIGIGLFIFFFYFPEKGIPIGEILPGFIPEEYKSDKFEPASQIKKPDSGVWQSKDFSIDILDEDLESGLDNTSCQYKILSYEPDGKEHSSGWQKRKCNFLSWVGVGLEKWCRFEGEKACWVFVSSEDRAGNRHSPAEEKGSVKYYHIDWTAPQVGKVFLEDGEAKVSISDNLKIAGCNLYLDNENLGPMSFLIPGCQANCDAFKTFNLELEPGSHLLFAVCQDAAGNYGKGEEFLIKENIPPKISSCRITPTQGNIQTNFQFQVEASDPDGDSLNFLWDFGDGENSQEKNPLHKYSQVGTFEPKVKVFDGRGGEDDCSTAWAIVTE